MTTITTSLRRVVVTGLGAVTPLGCGVAPTWSRLIRGESALCALTHENFPTIATLDLPSKVIAPVPRQTDPTSTHPFNVTDWVPRAILSQTSPFIHYALAASKQALDDSGYRPLTDEQRERFGVCIGSGIGSVEEAYESGRLLHAQGKRAVSPYSIPRLLVNLAAGQVSIAHDLRGPNHAVSTACTTGAHAIGDAFQFIQLGHADAMLAGGTEQGITPISMALFARCRALSTHFNEQPLAASRPFSPDRDGFVMGEGGAVMVLEEYEHAKRRGARIYAEVRGYGVSGDAHHITSPAPDGRGARLCMRSALQRSGLSRAEDVAYVNAHATSTPVGDKIESHAIKQVFGAHAQSGLLVSSTKGAVGHMLGAAGALEAIFTVLSVHHDIVPPTLNFDPQRDRAQLLADGIDLDYTPFEARHVPHGVRAALTNSFGFGDTNASLVFAKV